MTVGRGLAALGLLLVAGLLAVGGQLRAGQREGERAAVQRFEQRARITAALTQSMFGTLGMASRDDLRRWVDAPPAALAIRLRVLVRHGGLAYAAVRDGDGRLLASAGALPAGVSAAAGAVPAGAAGALSKVHRTAVGPAVAYTIPIGTGRHARRVVRGVRLRRLRAFLEEHLRRMPNPDRARLVITDVGGAPLAVVGAARPRERPASTLTAAAAIPETPWRLHLRADRADVLAGASDAAWVGWALLAGLAAALALTLALYARILASTRRTRAANVALRESEGKLRALVEALEEAIYLYHHDGRIERLNEAARGLDRVVGAPRGHAVGERRLLGERGEPLTMSQTPAARALATGEPQRQVVGVAHAGGEPMWLDVSARALTRAGEHHPYAAVLSCVDITERHGLEAHLLDLADRDPLTGLWNRRRFEQDLAHQLDRCRRYGERAGLVRLDIDGFRHVNGELGHLAGDELLCAMGEALAARVRSSDRVARLGGDEFAVLLLDADAGDLSRIAQELARLLRAAAAGVRDHVELTVGAGAVLLERSTGGVNEALDAADRALSEYKRGRGESERRPQTTGAAPAGDMASLRALVAAVHARDSYTALHSREVVMLARAVAQRMGLDEQQTSAVEHVALLHDVGKIAIPDAILRKPGPLTDHEQTLMRQHPAVGAEILASMPELAHLAPAVRGEHERWDGRGYPDGLAGEQIPIASRITLVCDAYHAMTSTRPYRRAMSDAAARAEIRRAAGTQFCPHAAEALLDVLTGARAQVAPGAGA